MSSELIELLGILQNGGTQIAVLDTSAACHMPDVLEMPCRPPLCISPFIKQDLMEWRCQESLFSAMAESCNV